MKCYNCGFESPEDFAFCPRCGAGQSSESQWGGDVMQMSQSGQVAQRVLMTLRDSLFLVICILFTVGTAIPIFRFEFPIINILLTIFLWLTYAKAQKGVASEEYLRCISGTVFASYVVGYVACGGIALGGLALIFLGTGGSSLLSDVMIYVDADLYKLFGGFGEFLTVLTGYFFIIGAVAGALVNYFGIRSIHRFVQSVYMGLDDVSIHPVKVKAAGAWLLVFGICGGIGAVYSLFGGNLADFISSGTISTAVIIGYVMVKKYYG